MLGIKENKEFKYPKIIFEFIILILVLVLKYTFKLQKISYGFIIFIIIVLLPILIMNNSIIINLIPSNIANSVTTNVRDIQTETSIPNIKAIDNIDILIIIVGVSTYIMSLILLVKQKETLIGIMFSISCCIISNIIINDIL